MSFYGGVKSHDDRKSRLYKEQLLPRTETDDPRRRGPSSPKLRFGPYWWRFGCSPLAGREVHWDAAKTHYELHSDGPIHQEAAGGDTVLSGRWLGLRQNFLITTTHLYILLNSLRWVPQDGPPRCCRNRKRGKHTKTRTRSHLVLWGSCSTLPD